MRKIISIAVALLCAFVLPAQSGRTTVSLNGTWEFEQTDKAFPPKEFTRKIPVPGLVHLAVPKIRVRQTLQASRRCRTARTVRFSEQGLYAEIQKAGGYLLTAEYQTEKETTPVVSRRYVKVGDENTAFQFHELNP